MPPADLRSVYQPGLGWETKIFGRFPIWTEEPSNATMKKLVAQHLQLDNEPEISFFASGALNKLYAFECAKGRYLMRVSLPVAPKVKTESEVATLQFVHETTTLPVPRVIASDSNLQNELGFEWIIMECIDARPLFDAWQEVSWLKKQLIVQQVATFCAQLVDTNLSGIGSLYYGKDGSGRGITTGHHDFRTGEIVLPTFFMEDAIKLDIDRGPYNSSRTYLGARLEIMRHTFTKYLASDDEDEVELGQAMQQVHECLEAIIPRYFPHNSVPEPTQLHHGDLNLRNILVDSAGNLASIVDWECVVALPAWQACELPKFLADEPVAFTALAEEPQPTDDAERDADNVEWYKEKMIDYEASRLREFFFEEMQRLSPKWMDTYRQEQVRRDIVLAFDYADNDITVYRTISWAETVLEGIEPKPSLQDGCAGRDALEGGNWV
jgi:hypothetical protein